MTSDRANQEELPPQSSEIASTTYYNLHRSNQERIHAALALLLGAGTDYDIRARATRRLARLGPSLLPLLLTTLSTYPEITTPAWPWWPPQYEHCSRLILHFSKKTHLDLAYLLHHPALSQPAGPVLWTSVMEAASLQPYVDHEALLCQGLNTPWNSVRYAAAMALAVRIKHRALQQSTLAELYRHLGEDEGHPVRLTAAYILLKAGESQSLDVLLHLMEPLAPPETRKAATFILTTDLPVQFSPGQKKRLRKHLVELLHEPQLELALYAAHALGNIASPAVLYTMCDLLEHRNTQTQIAALTALEDMAQRSTMRSAIRRVQLPLRVTLLLRSETVEVRRQSCYVLAVCGGEYVMAVLGTIIQNKEHPAHIEAIDSLRLLHGALRKPTLTHVLRWLHSILVQSGEVIQVTALDTLAYLLWEAQTKEQPQAWWTICHEIMQRGVAAELLHASSAWVRQRTIELLAMLGGQVTTLDNVPRRLLQILHHDEDSGVRACVAYVCGQIEARWALPDLLQALLDPDENVALTVLMSLEQLATPEDILVIHALQELISHGIAPEHANQQLLQAARTLLKKLRSRKKMAR